MKRGLKRPVAIINQSGDGVEEASPVKRGLKLGDAKRAALSETVEEASPTKRGRNQMLNSEC
jgi:hypothetical protein